MISLARARSRHANPVIPSIFISIAITDGCLPFGDPINRHGSHAMGHGWSRWMPAVLIALSACTGVSANRGEPPSSALRCTVDRARLLELDQRAFDQGATGWRAIANSRCHHAAAEIIREWRETHAKSDTILSWHEGQMRANANQYGQAISLFHQSRKQPSAEMAEAWNIYVDGSIAFLEADRPALEHARIRLARTSRPTEFNPIDSNGKPIAIAWPPNLAVLDSLLRCWGLPYLQAYSCTPRR